MPVDLEERRKRIEKAINDFFAEPGAPTPEEAYEHLSQIYSDIDLMLYVIETGERRDH